MRKIEPKAANRAAIHYSQQSALYGKYGEVGLMIPTNTQRLLQSGYTPFCGRKDVLKELGVRQVLSASPGMRDLYTLNYDARKGTGYIGRLSKEVQGLQGFVDMLEAKNMCRSHVYCDTSITGDCLFFAFYNRPLGNPTKCK